MIILMESVKLMEDGVIKGTGEKMIIEDQNGKREIDIPEPYIHISVGSRWVIK